MSCQTSSQEYVNGFCYDKCPAGYTGHNELCLQNCPAGFQDLGLTCSPPSILRRTTTTLLSPCNSNQIDRGGDCYEPMVTTFVMLNGLQVPRQSGCGCIRKTYAERLHCPAGYDKFNNGCVTKCPTGYQSILDSEGNIISMYCEIPCPKNVHSQEMWASIGNQCVKDFKSRVKSKKTTTNHNFQLNDAPNNRNKRLDLGLPSTVLSYLGSKTYGSSLQERVRKGQSIKNAKSSFPSSWTDLLSDPSAIIFYGIILFALFFAGPSLFKGLGFLFQFVLKGAGSLTESALETTGSIVKNVGTSASNLVGSSINLAASAENAAAKQITPQAV